jgi:hypothetical protein
LELVIAKTSMSPHWRGLYIACLGQTRNRGFMGG